MFTANQILDDNNVVLFEWVSNDPQDSIYLEDALVEGLPYAEWRKPHHLDSWIKQNKPNWKWKSKEVSISSLFKV